MVGEGDYCMKKYEKVGEKAERRKDIEVASSESSCKRRKMESNVDEKLVNHCDEVNCPEKLTSSEVSDSIAVSDCSSNESTDFGEEELRSVDLKVEPQAEKFETEISKFSRETTPSSELCANTDEQEYSSTATKPSPTKLSRKIPAAEIEEFFSTAEKHQQKIFIEKYNYDIVKDMPLEGRYQWIRLKP